MKNIGLAAAMAAFTAGAALASAGVHAQTTPLGVWQPAQHEEMDPAKRLPTPQPTPTAEDASKTMVQSPSAGPNPQPYADAAQAPERYEQDRGGFFIGVQGGKGWVYEDVHQTALAVNAGYRWQAGAVTLVGLEVTAGRLDDAEQDGWRYDRVDYTGVGVNARFNFGRTSPIYGLVRAGYWAADVNGSGDSVDGGYFGLGLGVDVSRQFNMSLVYTNHVYFNDYYWSDGDFYYDANRADLLMLGAEVRF